MRPLAWGWARLRAEPLFVVALFASVGIVVADNRQLPMGWILPCLALLWIHTWRRPTNTGLLATTALVFALVHQVRLESIHSLPAAPDLLAGAVLPAEATGVIVTEPRITPSGTRVRAVLRLESLEVEGHVYLGEGRRILLHRSVPQPVGSQPSVSHSLAYGDRIRVRGQLEAIPLSRNPGAFEPRAFHYRQNRLFARLNSGPANALTRLEGNQGRALFAYAQRTRAHFAKALGRGLEDAPEVAAILRAMTLGMREDTPEDLEEQFRLSGSLHIFAVSGLHLAIVAAVLWTVLRVLRLPRRLAALVLIPALLYYALLTGLRPSACRAAVMASVLLLGIALDRRPRLLNSLGLAALLLLALDSQQLFQLGFQLSFAVLAAIAVLAQPVSKALTPLLQLDPFLPRELASRPHRAACDLWGVIARLMGVSVAAWMGSLPLIAHHFHLVTPVAVFANLVLVPLATAILAVAAMSLAASSLGVGLIAELYNQCNWLLIKVLTFAAGAFASLPGGHLPIADGRREITSSPPPTAPSSDSKAPGTQIDLTVLDLGGGTSATVIEAHHPGHERRFWMIDTGPAEAAAFSLEPFLRSRAAPSLDGLILTHGDVDHLGFSPELLRRLPTGAVWQSPLPNRSPARKALEAACAATTTPQVSLHRDQVLRLSPPGHDTAHLTVLFPPVDYPIQAAADDQVLVLRLEVGSRRILFMSDAGFRTEKWLLAHEPDLRADVLVMGRHRSDACGLPEFLLAVEPRVVIATHADFPAAERIPSQWRSDLAESGIQLLDQSRCGAVTLRLRTDSPGLAIEPWLQKTWSLE